MGKVVILHGTTEYSFDFDQIQALDLASSAIARRADSDLVVAAHVGDLLNMRKDIVTTLEIVGCNARTA